MARILISVDYDSDHVHTDYPHLSHFYCRALETVGAVPYLAPCASAERLTEDMDALLLSGGGDVGEELYTYRDPALARGVEPGRDSYETALLRAFWDAGKPIFGVCRGMQLLNVWLGGDLWEDIPTEKGSRTHGDGQIHPVEVTPGSWLEALTGRHIRVNSYHHQACRNLAPALLPCAFSAEGICEAFSHRERPVWGVQWHPERMLDPMGEEWTDMRPLFAFWNRMAGENRRFSR